MQHMYHNTVTDTRDINKPIIILKHEQHSESNKGSNIVVS